MYIMEHFIKFSFRLHPNGDFGMHSRDAYPQFADVWVPPGYHIELLHISEYGFSITPGYLASLGKMPPTGYAHTDFAISRADRLLWEKVHTFLGGGECELKVST